MRVAIIGSGLAGLSTAVELVDQGCEVEIYEARPVIGGKVASWQDKHGNHIEMGLHVFFGCYYNLFALMAKVGALEHLLLKEHNHRFIQAGGKTGDLDFRNFGGAPFHGLKAFFTTNQLSWRDKLQNAIALGTSPLVRGLFDPVGAMKQIRNLDNISFQDWFLAHGGSMGSIENMWNAIAYGLGFIDCKNISARCMLTIFFFFATRTEASVLRMLEGSPNDFLHQPIRKYIEERGGKFYLKTGVRSINYVKEGNTFRVTGLEVGRNEDRRTVTCDRYVCAVDVPGVQKLIPPEWRSWDFFDRIYQLTAVPVVTVQLRFDDWVTDYDNLLYAVKVDFSTYADLAITSPTHYRKAGQGSLLQLVLTPGDPFMSMSNEAIVAHTLQQVHEIHPQSKNMNLIWSSVVKVAGSLYREAPGMDGYRPSQATPIPNFFLAGSYTMQDYIDSMEGATLSGKQSAQAVLASK